MVRSPKTIYEDLSKGKIDKLSASEVLISLIENVDDIDVRLESINTLQQINFKNDKIFSILENLLLSDSNENVRNLAAKALTDLFEQKALPPLKWALDHEKSLNCLTNIISNIGNINDNKAKYVILNKINEINKKKYRYNLKIIFKETNIDSLSNKELAELLIDYYIISSLKIRFGYLKFESNKSGSVISLDLSNVDVQSINKLTN